ncbi:hypothetical protein HYC85_020364 [Camellia sinensis]|uniref:Bulb-type lectin domain-containing protein n=1 Tax=Camellia sinensis TaxID=4442 RepID=A0A7J7GPK0_CAMSI|nr:hypothetical protein HYC85_020364 [Camellia sinensis]
MACIVVVVLLIFFILFAAIEARKNTSNLISLGSSLSPLSTPNSWLSPSGRFAFGFYRERNGFAVGIWINPNNTVVWTANRDYPPVSSNSTIEFTRDGRLILNNTQQGTELAIADFTTTSRVLSASMLDSGNFVIHDNNTSVIWQSFDFPTDTILGNQTLSYGHQLVSSESSSFDHSSGRYRLQMRDYDNLVAYPINCSDSDFAYASASASSLPGENGYYNLTITDTNLQAIIRAQTCLLSGLCCRITAKSMVSADSTVTAQSQPAHKLTAIVIPVLNKEGFGLVNISTLEKLRWFGLAYSVVPANNKEDCKKSCLEDCRCGAAMYVSGQCNKHKLPLRYGTRNLSDSDTYTAFVKFTSTTAIPNQIGQDSPSGPKVVTENEGHLISILAGSLGSLACLCIVIAISSFFLYRHRVHKYKKLSDNAKLGLSIDEFSLRSFSYNELEEATQGFREEMGKGSFGTVYKGTLLSGGGNKNIVAVKRLENIVEEAGDREFQFQTEVTAIGRTHHRNLGSSYLAPEWQQQQRRKQDLISVKVDIYSFGVVLLEIICSRRNIEVNVSNEDEMILSTWVYKCFVGGELHRLLVGDEEMRVDSKTLERMVKIPKLHLREISLPPLHHLPPLPTITNDPDCPFTVLLYSGLGSVKLVVVLSHGYKLRIEKNWKMDCNMDLFSFKQGQN